MSEGGWYLPFMHLGSITSTAKWAVMFTSIPKDRHAFLVLWQSPGHSKLRYADIMSSHM